MERILIIQTAFIGDVVLATGLAEKLHQQFPQAQIGMLVRKGNESLLQGHPFIKQVLVWDKKQDKYKNLLGLLGDIRARKYDKVINVQRFAATGFLTAFSGADEKIGFSKNPFSFLFDTKVAHVISSAGKPLHEVERNHQLIKHITDGKVAKPKLYPSVTDYEAISQYRQHKYICVAPASVWFTKQYPKDKWVSFISKLPEDYTVYLLGSPGDKKLGDEIAAAANRPNVINLSGALSFLQSAALQQYAEMNYVNDSAPLHFASAVNAPVTAVYCSTIPAFGFWPLSNRSFVVEINEPLACRPCGLHGRKACPQGHFNCANKIADEQLLSTLH